ncbi:MAG TPA: NAD(P)-dependent oxidoreductase, partial [Candidatus Limnocylindrales bacterium]|nr:NAD(P)-dependent oxidoreductase [Candidatus Limnocylindrales bacterium]
MTPHRIAIVGASGQLGSALAAEFARREVLAPPHAQLPIEDRERVAEFLARERPDVLINCSAFHHVDTCEREPERAFAINALAVDRAAEACAAADVTFVTISTDYVFDGALGRAYREDDAPNPQTAYGASKLAGELLTRRHGPRHLIVRISGVFGTAGTSNKGYTLVEKVLQQAERGEPTRMVADMVFSPSYAPHTARALRDLLDAGAFGTHHLA